MSAAKKASIIAGVDGIARSLISSVRRSERADDPRDRLTLDQKLDVFKELSRWVMILHRLDGTGDEGTAINDFKSKIQASADSGTGSPGGRPRAVNRDAQAATTIRDLLAGVPGYDGQDDSDGDSAAAEGESSDLQDAAGDQHRLRDQVFAAVGDRDRRPPVVVGTGRPGGDDPEDDHGGGD